MGIRGLNHGRQAQDVDHSSLRLERPLIARLEKSVDLPVEMSCKITGEPPGDIEWRHNNSLMLFNTARIKLYDDKQTLIIRSLTLDDAGTYECIARNSAGFLATACELVVRESPMVHETQIIKELIDVTPKEGKEVTLTCQCAHSPFASEAVSWFKNGTIIHEDGKREWGERVISFDTKEFTLKISNLSMADNGNYECRIVSAYGKEKSSFAQVNVTS